MPVAPRSALVGRRRSAWALALAASSVISSLAVWAVFRLREPSHATVEPRFLDGPAPRLEGVESSPRTGLLRRALTPEEIQALVPDLDSHYQPDPLAVFRRSGRLDLEYRWDEHPAGRIRLQTNAHGFRNEREVLAFHPDLRIVVAGDSHTDGVCDAGETFPAVLERELEARRPGWTIEALNGGVGGHCFDNYLGLLETVLPLEPDVFVVCVYGGNDLLESLWLRSMYEGYATQNSAAYREELGRAAKLAPGPVYQGLNAAKYFSLHVEQRDQAVRVATAVSREMVAICEERGIVPVFVYLPPMHEVQWGLDAEILAEASEILGLPAEDRHVIDGLADRWLAELRGTSAKLVDLRPQFRETKERLYWKRDAHINLAAHERIGRVLADTLDELAKEPSPRRGEPSGAIAAAGVEGPSWRDLVKDVAEDPLPELGLPKDRVERLLRLGAAVDYDPRRLLAVPESIRPRTSAEREDVVLLGDELGWESETSGCRLATLVEQRLRERGASSRCVDATVPGGGFHTALLAAREPDLAAAHRVVLVVDADTDFHEAAKLESAAPRAGRERERKREKKPEDGAKKSSRLLSPFERWARWPAGVCTFGSRPARAREGLRSASRATLQLALECRDRGSELLLVLVPPAEPTLPELRDAEDELGVERGEAVHGVAALGRTAEVWRRFAEENGCAVLDVAATESRLSYDATTLRLDARGREALAEAIAAALAQP